VHKHPIRGELKVWIILILSGPVNQIPRPEDSLSDHWKTFTPTKCHQAVYVIDLDSNVQAFPAAQI